MSKNTRKALSFLMAISILFSMLPMSVSAQPQTAPETQETTQQESVPLTPVTDTAPETTVNSQADTNVLVLGEPTDVTIAEGGQTVDFTFTPEESGCYLFYSISEENTYGNLYDSNMGRLTKNDDVRVDSGFQFQHVLTAGETYTLRAKYLNSSLTGTFQVAVKLSPLPSFSFTPISVIENTNGSQSFGYNPETGRYDLPYYSYYASDLLQKSTYTATFSDGTVLTGTAGSSFTHDGVWYHVTHSADQSYENQWTVGNTYYINVNIFNHTEQIPITIVECPLESFTYTPVTIYEETKGYYNYYWDNETSTQQEYFYYATGRFLEDSTWTATFKDGTVLTGTGCGTDAVTYKDTAYSIYTSTDQSSEKQWTVGNTYTAKAELMGVTIEIPVTIASFPLESLTFTPVTITENTTGSSITDGDVTYYQYDPWSLLQKSTYTATFNDGTVLTGTNTGFTYNDQWYSFRYTTDQSAENQWTMGNTYYVEVTVKGVTAQIPVTIEKSPLESITFTPVTVIENTCGNLNHGRNPETGEYDVEYFYYNYWSLITKSTYTATFTDGTVLTGTSTSFTYDEVQYSFNYSGNQSYPTNLWTVGNTYYINISVMGKTAQIPVTIVPSPLQSLTFTPVELIENYNGNWSTAYNPETGNQDLKYFSYDTWSAMTASTYTATFTDGTVLTGKASGFYYDDVRYNFERSHDQSYQNQWTVGNTYYIDIKVLGQTAQIPVTIVSSPLQSLTFTPVEVIEGTNGMTEQAYNPDTGNWDLEYYYYYTGNLMGKSTWTATFTDGTVLTGTGNSSLIYNDTYYNFNTTHDQSGDNPWTVGNTYYINVSVLGQSVQIPVSIVPLPLESLTFTPVTITEQTLGSTTTEGDVTYYQYDAWSLLQQSTYTATFKDGTTKTGNSSGFYYSGFYYDNNWIPFNYTTNQSAENQWIPGNTYYVEVSVKGVTAQIPVTIEKSPLESLTFTPITVIEGTKGELRNGYDPETAGYQDYYYYLSSNLLQNSTWTATFSDGTEQTGTGTYFWYNGEYYSFTHSADQNYTTRWTTGNTYYITVSVAGKTVQVPVTITPTPVVSITAEPISLTENRGGSSNSYWINGNKYTWYKYNWTNKLSLTVTFSDGTSYTSEKGSYYISYQDEDYRVETLDEQSSTTPWTAGNTYYATVTVMGVTVQVPVTVNESPVASIAFDPIVLTENEDGYWTYGVNGQYFDYRWENQVSYAVTFKDGTVQHGTGTYYYSSGIVYDDESYGVDQSQDEQYTTPWLVGNTYTAQVRFEGKWYDIPVTIARKTEENGFTYLVQDGKAIINGCTMQTEILQIPETLGGYPVVGIVSLGTGLHHALELRIPDGVTMMSPTLLTNGASYYNPLPLKKLTLGSGASVINMEMLRFAKSLECIEVAADNPNLCSIDGVVYNKDVTKLMAYPPAKKDLHIIPDSVTDISTLFCNASWQDALLANLNVQFGAGVKDYKMVDGVIYDADMTTILRVTGSAPERYVLPESVFGIQGFAFMNSKVKAVTLVRNVTQVTYTSFMGAINLEEITISSNVTHINEMGLGNSLKKVHIDDLNAWCNIRFWGTNPLRYAHDLYLNGELIKDLVLPETVSQRIYGSAFEGGSFESVTIPSHINEIGHDAFLGCENLKKVYITDLGAWSGTLFANATANPLYYARDLYLNGQLVTDLVLTETVTNRVYADSSWYPGASMLGVGDYAFFNASIQSVTVPASLEYFGNGAFAGCDNLEKVNISDLSTWCNIEFCYEDANPLTYAHNLYLNGEKVTDLVLPQSATGIVYVNNYTFYNVDIESLTVPSYVYEIRSSAFYGSSVEKITIEEGLRYIESYAFSCTNIQSLDLPDSLYAIGDYAFAYCSDLQTVTFGNGLDSIYSCAFRETGVKSIALPDSLTYLGSEAFADCQALEHVSFGNGLEWIAFSAFSGTGVKSIALPDSLTYLGSEAFADCQALEHVSFGKGLNVIPYASFRNTGLKTVTLPKHIECVESNAFRNSQLTEVIIECDSVAIWSGAFENCPLGDLEFGDNVTFVDSLAFAGTNATQIKLPASVTEISYRVYAFNENLVSVTIPDSVEFIHETAFQGDKLLSHVLYTGTQEQWDTLDTYSPELLNATLHCNAIGNEVTTTQTCTTVTYHCSICDKTETLRKGKPTHTFNEDEICTICGYEGYWEYEVDEKNATVTITAYTGTDWDVIVPDEIEGMPVTAISPDAFAYNRKIHSVVLPDSITQIPAEAFILCSSLESVTLGSKVTTIGDKAFFECDWLYEINLPDTLKTIGNSAFSGCWELRNVILPDSLTSIGEYAFKDTGIRKIDIPVGVTVINRGTFEGCWHLTELTLPNTVTSIVYYAFTGTRLTELTIPESVTQIESETFTDNNLETIIFLGDKPELGAAFDTGITMFYPGANKTWTDLPEDNNSWYACNVPTFTKQPATVTVEAGQTATVSAQAYGHRLSYQWYVAEPGAKRFTPVGGDSIELSMVITKANSGTRAYCMVTDILGQTAKSNTVTLKTPATSTGIRLSQLPYTLEYDLRQELRTRGLEVMLTFSDNTEEAVFDYTVTGYNPNAGGKQTITVTYAGFTASFDITVNEEKLNFANTEEKIELSAPEGAVDSTVELIVEKLEHDDEQVPEIPELPALPEILQQNTSVVFDISLKKGDEPVQPTEEVQVSIPVPEHMDRKRCKVFHIADDGSVTDMNASYKDGRMVFSTDHFSYYAVVEVTGVTISGKVTGSGDIAGTVVNLISGGEVLESVSVSKNGTYQFNDVVGSDYIIEAIQDGMPAKKTDITVTDRDMILDILLAILGDIDGNSEVNTDDVVQLLLHVSMPDLFPVDAIADFTGDNDVSTDDVIKLLLHVSMPDLFPLGV